MRSLVVVWVCLLGACDSDSKPEPERLAPDDWQSSLVMVKGCRSSPDHDLERVALWVDAASQEQLARCVDAFPDGGSTCADGFPEGALFVKPQYSDEACSVLVRLSVAKKDATYAATGGWHWQEILVDGAKEHVSQDGALKRCYTCHATCTGFDQRCYMDP